MLSDPGYRVTSTTRPREVLALLRPDPSRFDLVITGQTMPEIAGEELVKEILAIRPDTHHHMHGFSPLVDDETAKAAGVRAFAMKPLTRGRWRRHSERSWASSFHLRFLIGNP
jgi:DNA-binding NtrC family response regulator